MIRQKYKAITHLGSLCFSYFDYAKNLCFSENAVEKAMEAIKKGACIVTDTQMAKSGINKKALAKYGGEVYCFISDEDVAAIARYRGVEIYE